MRRFEITRPFLGETITALILELEEGVHVSVFGGQRTHIGAVSIAASNGGCTTTQFPGHRDGVVSERWAKALSETGYCPAVVEAGIHYDGLSREGIVETVALTDAMLEEALALLQGKT